ncbi:MAG: hypothetical protein R3F15_03035 [Lysobacterales bacterium]
MLDAVLLVLREVLEAALFISILLALCRKLALPVAWVWPAVLCGLLGSWLLSHYAAAIGEAFDGSGQERVNALLYLLAIGCFVLIDIVLVRDWRLALQQPGDAPARAAPLLCTLFGLIVAASMAREGSEVWIYLSAFVGQRDALLGALMGGLIGAGLGVSIGVLVYYLFSFQPRRWFLPLYLLLAALVAGGLSMQFAKQLMQMGWLDSGNAVWDSGWLVDERGWFGQFLHAAFGYDANPDLTQVLCYLAVLILISVGGALRWWRHGLSQKDLRT